MTRNVNIPIESSFITNGYGYITVPSDMTRDRYLKDYYRTGQCIILTTYNEVKRRVSIPKHLINDLEFPILPGERGSLVHWQRIPGTGQLVVTGVHLITTEFTSSSEKEKVSKKATDNSSISTIENLELNSYTISVSGSRSIPGEINLLVKDDNGGSAKFTLNGAGIVTVDTTELDIDSSSVNITIDKDKSMVIDGDEMTINFGSHKISIDEDMVVIDSEKFVSISSKKSSVNITSEGVIVETDKKIFLNGSKPVLYAKSEVVEEILDFSQIGVSKSIRIGE